MFRRKKPDEPTSAAAQWPPPVEHPTMDRDTAVAALRQMRASGPTTCDAPDPAWLATFLHELAPVLSALEVSGDVVGAVRAGASAIDDPSALFSAGFQLFDVGLGDLAVGPLARAAALMPDEPQVINELALAVEMAGRPDEAARVFREHGSVLGEESSRALYSHFAAMAGDLETTRQLLPTLDPSSPFGFFADRARGRIERGDALARRGRLTAGDLRGWDAAINGTLLLARSEFGADDGMNGRFGALWDSADRCSRMLVELRRVLAHVGRIPTRVVFAPDRDSEVLAWAVSSSMGLGAPLDLGAPSDGSGPTLVVAFDWSSVDAVVRERFAADRGAVLFAYALDWTRQHPIAPDVVGLEAQAAFPAWGSRMRALPGADGLPGEIVDEPPDAREPHLIGADLAATAPMAADPADEADLAGVVDAIVAVPASVGLLGGARTMYYPDGPVRSARFM